MMAVSLLDEASGWLEALFAPWVQALNLKPLKVAGGEAELLLPFDPALVARLLDHVYRPRNLAPRGCHPRDLIDQSL